MSSRVGHGRAGRSEAFACPYFVCFRHIIYYLPSTYKKGSVYNYHTIALVFVPLRRSALLPIIPAKTTYRLPACKLLCQNSQAERPAALKTGDAVILCSYSHQNLRTPLSQPSRPSIYQCTHASVCDPSIHPFIHIHISTSRGGRVCKCLHYFPNITRRYISSSDQPLSNGVFTRVNPCTYPGTCDQNNQVWNPSMTKTPRFWCLIMTKTTTVLVLGYTSAHEPLINTTTVETLRDRLSDPLPPPITAISSSVS